MYNQVKNVNHDETSAMNLHNHPTLSPVEEILRVSAQSFRRDVVPKYRPVIFRGLVDDWSAVQLAKQAPESVCQLLVTMDTGHVVDAVMAPPAEKGRLFYNESLDGFNFLRNKLTLSQVIGQIMRYSHFTDPPSVAVQSALIADCAPDFLATHDLHLIDSSIQPRLWIGNSIRTPAHFDESSNIACVVAGTRRFTLFPPEQIKNLYIGPLDFAPTGTPISLVNFSQPDFDQFPLFRAALATAVVADVGPGDAIYIPPLWWHHVESFAPFNMLVNYWWREDTQAIMPSGIGSLWHALASLRQLPDHERKAWSTIFQHYVFGPTCAAEQHLPASARGILAEMSAEQKKAIRKKLREFVEHD